MLFTSTLKNLYGTIEISDKAMRASIDDAGAFVNLLTAEMEGLLEASKFNLSRMLYGDGSGCLCSVSSANVSKNEITVDDVSKLLEGMVIDFYNGTSKVSGFCGVRIASIDRASKKITLSTVVTTEFATSASSYKVYMQNSKDQELTGIEKIFETTGSIYGVNRTSYPWINAYTKSKTTSDTFNDIYIQTAIDTVLERTGNEINFIATTSALKRKFASLLMEKRANLEPLNLQGGYRTLSFNGIPMISDKFIPSGTMYLLNTNDFAMHQLCDWEWLTHNDGSILKQKEGYATYSATLVKYADLICDRPNAQALITL